MSHKRNAQDEVFTYSSSPVVNTIMVTNNTLQGKVQTTPPELSLLRRVSTWGWLRLSSCAYGCSPLWDLWLMTAVLKGGAGGGHDMKNDVLVKGLHYYLLLEAGAAELSHSYQLTTRKGPTLHCGTERRSTGRMVLLVPASPEFI